MRSIGTQTRFETEVHDNRRRLQKIGATAGLPKSRTVIVEKTDRLYRNFQDYVKLEDLGVEIHLAKEGRIIGKDTRSVLIFQEGQK